MGFEVDTKRTVQHAGTPSAQNHASAETKWMKIKIADAFATLGSRVAKYPKSTLLINTLVTFTCFAGVFTPNMVYESKSENLWVPTDSLAYKTYVYNDEVYGSSYYNTALVQPAGSEGPVRNQLLTKDVFDAIWVLDNTVRNIKIPSNGRSFSEMCTIVGGSCTVYSPLLFWSDYNNYASTVSSDADIVDAVSASTFANGFNVSRRALFGNYEEDTESGALTTAYGTSISYQLDSKKVTSAEAQEFEDAFLLALGLRGAPSNPVMHQVYDALYIEVYGYRSLDAELTRVVTIDMPLVLLEYIVMYVFIVAALSWGAKTTKAGQAAGAVMSCVASMMAAYGVCAACGIPITQLIFILPFILVGIGVDDAFVIVAAYKQVELSEAEVIEAAANGIDLVGARLAKALGRCALSITYTTLTDVAAFGLGCMGTLPAVRYFCAYAAVAVAADFLYQVTFFVAVLAIDERRTEVGASYCCCSSCCTSSNQPGNSGANCRSCRVANAPAGEADSATRGVSSSEALIDLKRTRELANQYMAVLANPKGAIGVMLAFFLFTLMCAWSATNLSNEFSPSEIVPDDSYTKAYFSAASKLGLFWDSSIPYDVIFKDGADIADPSVQADAKDLLVQLSNYTVKSEGPVSWWLDDFLAWAPTQSTLNGFVNEEGYFEGTATEEGAAAFEAGVVKFLSTYPFERFGSEVAFWDDGSMRSSRATLYHYGTAGAKNKIEAMVATYEKCKASPLGTEKAISFAQPYIFITQFMIITRETVQNLICSFVAVWILSWLVLRDTRAVGAVLLCLAAIDVDLLGLLWLWGLELNGVTMISLIMAIGLVVDYLAHLMHCFMAHTAQFPDPRDRMAAALAEVGGAVALGGFTTFVGILPLAFASSFIYRVFFKLFLCIVGLGLVHGFVVIPVIVCLLYPSVPSSEKCKIGTLEKKTKALTLAKDDTVHSTL